jgi:hypothetical protein
MRFCTPMHHWPGASSAVTSPTLAPLMPPRHGRLLRLSRRRGHIHRDHDDLERCVNHANSSLVLQPATTAAGPQVCGTATTLIPVIRKWIASTPMPLPRDNMPSGQLPKSLASSSLYDASPPHNCRIAAPTARKICVQRCKKTFSTASVRLGKARAEQNESALPRAADISADSAGSRRRAWRTSKLQRLIHRSSRSGR